MGRVGTDDAAMASSTPHLRPIDHLRTEWEVMSRSPQSRQALRSLAAAEDRVAAVGGEHLGDLVAALRRAHGATARARAAGVVQAMLRSQEVHPLVPRAILQAVVPGLVTVARRLRWGEGGDWQDGGAFFADLLATAWEVIVSWSGQDRDYAVLDLLSAVRCRLRRQVVGQRTSAERVQLGLGEDETHLAGESPGASGPELLARAIEDLRGRGLHPADAAVLYGHQVLGLTMTELARMTGRTRRQLDRRRHRALQRLCA